MSIEQATPVKKYNYIHYEVWVKITYPFPNFKGVAVEVWELIMRLCIHAVINVNAWFPHNKSPVPRHKFENMPIVWSHPFGCFIVDQ